MRDLIRETFEKMLANAVVEPLIVLDAAFCITAASRSFYAAFHYEPAKTVGRSLFEIGGREWDIAALRTGLDGTLANNVPLVGSALRADIPGLGRREIVVSASLLAFDGSNEASIVVAISDVTERRALDARLHEKDLLLREMNHRVANSLQIIASILLLKAHAVQSEDTRRHLEDAHERVTAVSRVQEFLSPSLDPNGRISAGTYLSGLCSSLKSSMVDGRPIEITVTADPGDVGTEEAVSMGLITTELVINALKHAFPGDPTGCIRIRFESSSANWRLTVSDDGIGISTMIDTPPTSGLGTSILEALTRQLGGRMLTSSNSPGTKVAITVPRTETASTPVGGKILTSANPPRPRGN